MSLEPRPPLFVGMAPSAHAQDTYPQTLGDIRANEVMTKVYGSLTW